MKFEFKQDEDGYYVDKDGCQHRTQQAAHHFGTLGLCGCGDPDGTYNFIREVLKCFDRRGAKGGDGWINAEKAVMQLIIENIEDATLAFIQLLDACDSVLEHGGYVGGSWLTDEGAAIVDLPEATHADYED